MWAEFARHCYNTTAGLWRAGVPAPVECKQIELVFLATPKNLSAGIIAIAIITAGLLSMQREPLDTWLLAGWATLQSAVLSRGILLARAFLHGGHAPADILRMGDRLVRNGTVAGMLWGSLAFLVHASSHQQQLMFTIAAVALVVMGGAGAQAPYRRLAHTFVLATASVFVAGLMVHPHIHPMIAAGFILYAVVAINYSAQQQTAIREIIELNLDKERLLAASQRMLVALEAEKQRADQASDAKTRFLAAASHDLRQPMQAISLYSGSLRHLAQDTGTRDAAEKIASATEAMETLLDAVLDLSRVSLGMLKTSVVPVAMADTFRHLEIQLRPEAAAKGLALHFPTSRPCILTDPVLLERILRNLLLNAIRYTSHGSVQVRTHLHGAMLHISVADTGQGIPAVEHGRIFEEFYQIGNPERDMRKGLGLGLSIVAQLCRQLEIPLRFRSRVGYGTIFRLALPLCPAHAVPAASPAGAASGSDHAAGASVLVIDDNVLVLDALHHTLAGFGCRVVTATSLADALAQLQQEECSPDIILSDYRLRAGENGIATIAALRQTLDDDAPATPALLLSGDTSVGEMEQACHHGIATVHKPVQPERLHALLNDMLRRYRAALGACSGGDWEQ
jgi:signal transduction histidine kinase/ActR/RegA family two-component response regulator